MIRFFLRASLLAAAVLAVGGCSSSSPTPEQPPCPRVSVLSDTAKLTRFRPGAGRDITDVDLQAELVSYHGSCQFNFENRLMTITLQVGLDAHHGPAAQGHTANLAYFVAIPEFRPDPKAKAIMPVSLVFPDKADSVHYVDDEVDISFPIPQLKDLAKYEVFVGLQLTPAELDYNREQKIDR